MSKSDGNPLGDSLDKKQVSIDIYQPPSEDNSLELITSRPVSKPHLGGGFTNLDFLTIRVTTIPNLFHHGVYDVGRVESPFEFSY